MTKAIPVMLFIAAIMCCRARADSIDYTLTLTVDATSRPFGPCDPSVGHQFGCDVTVGSRFIGSFLVDDALLTETGSDLSGLVSDFFLQMGTVVWDQEDPSDFMGFRGPGGFASSPGFDVSDGMITGLEGGVYGQGDLRWVDFFGTRFNAVDGRGGLNIQGRLELATAPEPSSIVLFGVGLAGLIGARLREKRRRLNVQRV